jgi:hypothetical protein
MLLLAKLALGMTGTIVLAGAYTFHDGVMRVDVDDRGQGHHVHVWAPAAVVPMAMHFVPRRNMEHAIAQVQPWLPTLRALTHELEKYPEAEFVDVRDEGGDQHVRIRMHGGKIMIDVDQPDEHVHIACPLPMMRDVTRELEADIPTV